jgi:signal transduction histidine kinase
MLASTNSSIKLHMAHTTRPLLARLNWYWILQLLGWTLVALFNLLAYSRYFDKPGVIATCIWSGASGLLLSDLWHRLLKARRWTARVLNWRMIAVPVLLLGPLQAASILLALRILQGKVEGLQWLPMSLFLWGGIFLAWNIAYMAALALRRANQFEATALRMEVLAKDAELRALQAQVNPHFFFNSLNSIRALVYESPDAASQMIDRLASLMRYALQSGQDETVALQREVQAVEAYLAIEKIRFEARLRVSIEIEAGLEEVKVPPMSLQTLVENAVKYGVETSTSGSDIRISARRAGGNVLIEVANAGAIRSFGSSTRVGLNNARKRLTLAMGDDASLDLTENGGWVRATLQFPMAA